MTIRISTMTMLFLFAVLPIGAEELSFERTLMGTRFRVVCHIDNRSQVKEATQAVNAAFEIAGALNDTASDYIAESELSRLGTQAAETPVPLSASLYVLLDHSRRLAEAADGAFDPSLGPLTKLWRKARDQGRLPKPEILRAARSAVGWQNFTLDAKSRSITLHQNHMAFDLGGVAKGYAADLMFESLAAAGFPRVLIAAGGDIRLGDAPPGREGWRVALQTFDPARPDEVIVLVNAAVSTSGDLYQSVEIEGVRYSHLLNPATGLGLTQRIAVSVIADEAKLSDPLATAACVLGVDDAMALRKLPGVREVKVRTVQEPMPTQR